MRSHLHSLGSKLERRIKSCLDLPEEGSSSSTGGKDFDYMTLMFTPRSGDDADDSASATPSALPSIASSTESEPYRPTFTKKTGRDRMFSIVPRKARAPHSKHYDRIPDAKRAEALIALAPDAALGVERLQPFSMLLLGEGHGRRAREKARPLGLGLRVVVGRL